MLLITFVHICAEQPHIAAKKAAASCVEFYYLHQNTTLCQIQHETERHQSRLLGECITSYNVLVINVVNL